MMVVVNWNGNYQCEQCKKTNKPECVQCWECNYPSFEMYGSVGVLCLMCFCVHPYSHSHYSHHPVLYVEHSLNGKKSRCRWGCRWTIDLGMKIYTPARNLEVILVSWGRISLFWPLAVDGWMFHFRIPFPNQVNFGSSVVNECSMLSESYGFLLMRLNRPEINCLISH